MVRFNLSDGRTPSFDLTDMESARAWLKARADSSFQAAIRGAQLDVGGAITTLPLPAGFTGQSVYDAELLAKDGKPSAYKLTCFLEKIQITVTAYLGKRPFSRVDVHRVGRLRHAGFTTAAAREHSD